jgi:hypothetical protein
MSPSLGALLESLIDYAGLFPPARLPLDEAITNHLHYLGDPDGWMIGRFVCPAARLPDLLRGHSSLFAQGPRFGIAALGRGGATSDEFLANLAADRADLTAFTTHWATAYVDVDVLEVRLPADAVRDAGQGSRVLAELAATGLQVFVEVPSDPEISGLLPGWLQSLKAAGNVGFKLRTGGLEAAAVPSTERVASVLWACVQAGVPFKATAGLHHPLPRVDADLGARVHGFVNLFTAGVLAHARKIDAGRIRQILDDDQPGHFLFGADGLRWGDLQASREEIRRARCEAVLSFGSCSFVEPRDELRGLGWL